MSATAAFVQTWSVGERYQVTLTAPLPEAGRLAYAACEWFPCAPHHMSRRETDDYIRGRDAAMKDVSRELGLVVIAAHL